MAYSGGWVAQLILTKTFIELTPGHRLVDVDEDTQLVFLNGVLQRPGSRYDYAAKDVSSKNKRENTITLKFNSRFQEGDVLGTVK